MCGMAGGTPVPGACPSVGGETAYCCKPADSDTDTEPTGTDSDTGVGTDTGTDTGGAEPLYDLDPNLPFWEWLLEYIKVAYPDREAPERHDEGGGIFWHGVTISDNGEFFMGWWQGDHEHHSFAAVEDVDIPSGEAIYVGTTEDKGWTEGVEYTPGVGYLVLSYDAGVHGDLNIGGTCVAQLNADAEVVRTFVDKMVAERLAGRQQAGL